MSESSVFPSQPPPPPTRATPLDRWRWLLSGIIAILGGYITLGSLNGGFNILFAGLVTPEAVVLAVLPFVFGILVTALGYFFVPAPLGRRILAKVVLVVGALLLILGVWLRMTTGAGGLPLGMTLANAAFMLLLFGGLGWLIACRVEPIRYLVLLVALIAVPGPTLLTLAGVAGAVTYIVQLVLARHRGGRDPAREPPADPEADHRHRGTARLGRDRLDRELVGAAADCDRV